MSRSDSKHYITPQRAFVSARSPHLFRRQAFYLISDFGFGISDLASGIPHSAICNPQWTTGFLPAVRKVSVTREMLFHSDRSFRDWRQVFA